MYPETRDNNNIIYFGDYYKVDLVWNDKNVTNVRLIEMISSSSLSYWREKNENISVVDKTFPSGWDNHPIREILSPGGCARKEFFLLLCSLCLRAREPSMLGWMIGCCGRWTHMPRTPRHPTHTAHERGTWGGRSKSVRQKNGTEQKEEFYLWTNCLFFFPAANTHLSHSQNPMPQIGGTCTNPTPLPVLVLPCESLRSWINRRMSFRLTHQVERLARIRQGGLPLLLSGAHRNVRHRRCLLESELVRWPHLP